MSQFVTIAGLPVALTLENLDLIVNFRIAERKQAELRDAWSAEVQIETRTRSAAALATALASIPLQDAGNIAFLKRDDFAMDDADTIKYRIEMLKVLESRGQSVADIE